MIDYDDSRFHRYPVPADEIGEEMPNHWFMLDDEHMIVSLLCYVEDKGCYTLGQEVFTPTEYPLIAEVFAQAPWFTPHENLYALHHYGGKSEKKVERARKTLLQSVEDGIFDKEMRSTRGALSRGRLKINNLGITISAMTATGYMLRRYSPLQEAVNGARKRKLAYE